MALGTLFNKQTILREGPKIFLQNALQKQGIINSFRKTHSTMKSIKTSLLLILITSSVQAQFFVQKLNQDQIPGAEKFYVVTNDNDTIYGKMSSQSLTDGVLTQFTLKKGKEKTKYNIEQVKAIGVIPGPFANYEDMALLPVLKDMKNEDFISVLPPDGWVYFERIRLPGKQERYQLAQVRNPGFDSKIKVYTHPDADDGGSTTVNSLTLTGEQDDQHYVSLNNERPFVLSWFKYRKSALEKLYNNCVVLSDKKLKWSEFAKHVFTFDQQCID